MMRETDKQPTATIVVVMNWLEELKTNRHGGES
jgi:hypothetical protein